MQWRHSSAGYLRKILNSKVYDIAVRRQSQTCNYVLGDLIEQLEAQQKSHPLVPEIPLMHSSRKGEVLWSSAARD